MATSAGELIYTIGADASPMLAAASKVDSAAKEMADALNQASASAEKAGEALIGLANDATRLQTGISKSASAVTGMIQQLRLEALTVRMNANEKALYIAALKGATAAELQEIASLQVLAGASNSSKGGVINMRYAVQNLGYQMQDIAVQLQMGASAFTVLGQQGSQVASIFGPGGAVIGAIIAVASAIGGALIKSLNGANAEFDVMTAKVGELQSAQRKVATDEISAKLDKVNSRIKDFSSGTDAAGVSGTGWTKTISFNTEGLHKQQAALEALKAEQKSYQDRLKELSTGTTKEATSANEDWKTSVIAGTIALKDGEKQAAIYVRTQEIMKKAKENGQSNDITQAQIKVDTDLINKQYEAKDAHDAAEKAKRASESATKKDLSAQKQVVNQLEDSASKAAQLGIEYNNLKKGIDENSASTSRFTLESATLEAQRQLGSAATEKQIDAQARNILKIHEETDAIDKLKKKQAQDKETTNKFTTVESKVSTKGENVDSQYKDDIKALNNYHKMAGASDARYQKTKSKLEEKYRKDKQAAAIEDYKAQSEWNKFLMDGLDALGQSATTTIAGLASGTMTATQAMQNFASIILNQAVGALVEMGINQIKNTMLSDTMAATQQANIVATNATGIAAGSANAAAQAGNAATVAAAAAPAAAATATFSWGTAAVVGGAALLATYAIAKSAGGRQFGGSVNAGGMYRVGENGRAEVFTQGGRNYLLPGDGGGQVTPMSGTGGGGFSQNVSIVNTSGASVSHNTSADGKQMRILVEQTVSKSISEKRGRIYSAFNRTTNLQSRAR